ncbi:unnamed protein product, partial [Prorocentrum cordatum]
CKLMFCSRSPTRMPICTARMAGRASEARAPTAAAARPAPRQDKCRPDVAPTKEDVWYECHQLSSEETRLRLELDSWRARLRAAEDLTSQHEELACAALGQAACVMDTPPRPAVLGLIVSPGAEGRAELHRLQKVTTAQLVVTEPLTLGSRRIPAGSVLLQEHSMRLHGHPARGRQWSDIGALDLPARLSFLAPGTLPGSVVIASASLPPARAGRPGEGGLFEASLLAAQVQESLAGGAGASHEDLAAKCATLVRRLLPAGGARAERPAVPLGDALAQAVRSCSAEKQWGSEDLLLLARLCESCGALGEEAQPPRAATRGTLANPAGAVHPLLERLVTADQLAEALGQPCLPDDHAHLEEAVLTARQLAAQLRGPPSSAARAAAGAGGELDRLAREVEAGNVQLQERLGQLDLLEVQAPTSWSVPPALWEDLVGSRPPPAGAPAAEWRRAAQGALLDAKVEAGRLADERRVRAERGRAEVDRLVRERILVEAEADALEAENRMLEAEIGQQSRRRSGLQAGRARGAAAARASGDAWTGEARRRSHELMVERRARVIQRRWRGRRSQEGAASSGSAA